MSVEGGHKDNCKRKIQGTVTKPDKSMRYNTSRWTQTEAEAGGNLSATNRRPMEGTKFLAVGKWGIIRMKKRRATLDSTSDCKTPTDRNDYMHDAERNCAEVKDMPLLRTAATEVAIKRGMDNRQNANN